MSQINLETNLQELQGVGPTYAKRLESLGLKNVQDLLFYFPRRWDDFSNTKKISEIKIGETASVLGTVYQIAAKQTFRRRMGITEAVIMDSSGMLKAVWFNQPYISGYLKNGDKVAFSGKLEHKGQDIVFQNPVYEKFENKNNTTHTARIVPVYSQTSGVTSKWLRWQVKSVLGLADKITDFLPLGMVRRLGMLTLPEAIREIHFPQNQLKLKKAKERLSFDEMFLIQLNALQIKKENASQTAPQLKFDESLAKKFVASLSFKLTSAQRKAAWEILQDLEHAHPANRLLEGDVGSGKTVVSAMAVLMAHKSGYQSCFMAPTEILATQQFEKFSTLLGKFDIKITLLKSGAGKAKENQLAKIKKGEIALAVGTHALIQDKVSFKNLGLVVVDEQHRFGVVQRATLREKAGNKLTPHFISMTATPIPRTLALALYGDLDISLIDEMPVGRQKIVTKAIDPAHRKSAYEFIKDEIKKGRQCFVVCPYIKNDESITEKKAVETEFEKLSKKIFPKFKIEMLHGRMKSGQKDAIMEKFKKGKIDVLVSTSVVEVGVDIPNASVMMVEGAERFGLAQLHQLRGRVGRSTHQSYCFLFSQEGGFKTMARLKALVSSNDGFGLAEQDLQIRGPGEVYGTRQHGIPDLKMASLTDVALIKKARGQAEEILAQDPDLKKYPRLWDELERFNRVRHLE